MDAIIPLVALIALALCAIPFGVDSRPDYEATDREGQLPRT
jgi:hypothetical protein